MEGLGLSFKAESIYIVRQRQNHLLAMLNGLGFGNVITVFVQIKAFGALITICVLPCSCPALRLLPIIDSRHSRCIS